MNELDSKQAAGQRVLGLVTARQFYGIDINTFAIELAKVTMMIGRKLAIDELHINERSLPLDNLDSNFFAADALIDELGNPVQWPKVDVIIGNPPFLGAKRLKPEHGSAYINKIRKAYPQIPGMADYCVYWFRKAHDHLPQCTLAKPFSGHAGLVGTQNIRNNTSRSAGLGYICETGTIIEAVDNQPWSGEANVHVSIANWVKTQDKKLLPAKKRLWSKLDLAATSKTYELIYNEYPFINSSLSASADISQKKPLECSKHPKRCFQGKIPGYEGFLVGGAIANCLRKDSAKVVVPYLTGRELLDEFKIERWAIDFRNLSIIDAAAFKSAFEYCKQNVLPAVQQSYQNVVDDKSDMVAARKDHLDRWWQFWNRRDELTTSLKKCHRYIGCSRVTRRPIMVFLSSSICPSDLIQVFAFDDDYSFGILQSICHFEWFRTSSRLKVETDTRYSVREVFETFPWPQNPTLKQIDEIAQAGCEIRRIREMALKQMKGGLRAVYRILELPGKNELKDAHIALDEAVYDAYGFSKKANLLAQILELNLKVASDIEAGKPVTAPGIPPHYKNRDALITEDCVDVGLHDNADFLTTSK